MSDIEIEIDGKPLTAKPNSMVIEVADAAGIYIPRFCYHKHLTVAANCRMCLVEVEKSPKALPACATPITPGMKVFTRSPKALAAQKAVMEFLLINHPLDCPICDQGGECELQDLSMGYGSAKSYFNEGKRSIKDKDIGPLIETEMTRCIQCTRCVRFGAEVAGLRELGAVGRGEHMEISTYIEQSLHSEVSGNIIDLCPVGALTSKPFRFTARAWELDQYPSIAAHDCVGSNINVHTRYGKVMRVVPRENNDINQTWISDRDRFSYEGLYHADRLANPMVKVDGKWRETDWETAFQAALNGLQQVLDNAGAEQIGALVSPNATLEEMYLLQRILRQLGSSHIDHRLRQSDFSDQDHLPLFPGLSCTLDELEQSDVIVLIGSNIQKEQPSLGLRVRKAALNGAKVIAINMVDYRFHFALAGKQIVAPHELVTTLTDITHALHEQRAPAYAKTLADVIAAGKKIQIILGAAALHHPHAAMIHAIAHDLAANHSATVSVLTDGANSAGAWISGAIPHRGVAGEPIADPGLDAAAMLADPRKAYILLNVEPDLDSGNPVLFTNALEQADCVLALSMFRNPVLEQFANVILPIAPFTETSGTFVNALGQWQTFRGAANPVGESRPAWKVLRVLGNFLHLEGFDYESTEDVLNELKVLVGQSEFKPKKMKHGLQRKNKEMKDIKLSRIGDIPMYAVDSLVRRANALQATQAIIYGDLAAARMHPKTLHDLKIKHADIVTFSQNDAHVQLPVVMDERIPPHAVFIAGGIVASSGLQELFGEITLSRGTD